MQNPFTRPGDTSGDSPVTLQQSGGAAGTPTDITVANEATDATCFPLFVTAATGDLGPKTNANLKFDSSTGILELLQPLIAPVSLGAITGKQRIDVNGAGLRALTTSNSISDFKVAQLEATAASPFLLNNGQNVTVALTAQTTGAATLTIPDLAGAAASFLLTTLAQTITGAKTLGTDTKLYCRDSAIHISSTIDGQLDIVADTLVQIGGAAGGAMLMDGLIGEYNNVSTAGWGVPAIYAVGRATAQTAAKATLATYTDTLGDGSYIISGNVLVTASTTHSFSMTVTYDDEDGTSRTLTLNFSNLAGTISTLITNAGGAVPYEGIPVHIRANGGSTITVQTTGTFTSVTYNCEAIIQRVA